MEKEEHYRKLERMYARANSQQSFETKIEIWEGSTRQVLNIKKEYHHAADAVHGHLYFKMMDDTSFFATNSLVEEVFVLTVGYTVYFVRPVAEGEMIARGNVVFRSKSLYIAESRVTNSDGKEIARGSGTFMRSKVPLTPEIGYE